MKLSICLPTLFVLVATSAASAQIIQNGPTISDSVHIPTLPGSSAGITGESFAAPVESAIVGSPIAAEGYAGDLAPIDGSISGSSVSGGSADGGEVVNLGVISEGAEGALGGAGCRERTYGQPDLFYNYYTQGNCNRANAQMYLSPHPVPPNVGHTFYTYQPFYPQEYLYWHKNKFHNYYDNGRGYNRTRALYYSPPIHQAVSNIYWNKIRLPR